jgi:phage-related minor tail protein
MANAIKVDIIGSAKGLMGALGQAKTALTGFSATSGAASIAAGGVALAGVAALGALTVAALDMDQNMREFEVSTGLTGDALATAWDNAQDAMARVPESFEEVAAAAGNLSTTTGFMEDDLENLTVQFMDLNRLGFGAITENDVGEIMKGWGLDAEGVGGHLDDLATISQATGVDIALLEKTLSESGQTLQNMGMDLEESTALIAHLEANGVNAGKAIKGLKSGMADMTPEEQAEAWATLNEAMADGTITAEEQKAAFDILGSSATEFLGAMQGSEGGLDALKGSLQGNEGATAEMAETMASLGQRLTIIKNQIMIALVPVMEALVVGVEAVITAVEWLAERAPEFFADVSKGAELLWEVIGPVFDGIVAQVKGTFEIIMGIWDTFSAIFRGDWAEAWEGIKRTLGGVMDNIKGTLQTAMALGLDLLIDEIKKAPSRILTAAESMGSAIMDGIKNGLGAVGGIAGDVAGDILRAIKGVVNSQVIDRINRALEISFNTHIPGVGTIEINPRDIRHLRHGGTASGRVLVGEDGPEVLNLGMNSGRVTSRRESGGSDGDVIVNVFGSEATPEGIGAAVLWDLRRA